MKYNITLLVCDIIAQKLSHEKAIPINDILRSILEYSYFSANIRLKLFL